MGVIQCKYRPSDCSEANLSNNLEQNNPGLKQLSLSKTKLLNNSNISNINRINFF